LMATQGLAIVGFRVAVRVLTATHLDGLAKWPRG
jgi:hypothetical protein